MNNCETLLAFRRCDRCFKDHKKCSRNLSGCQCCIKAGWKCTYLSDSNKNKGLQAISSCFGSVQKLDFRDNTKNSKIPWLIKTPYTVRQADFRLKLLVKNFRLRSIFNVLISMLGGNIFDRPLNSTITEKVYNQFYPILEAELSERKISCFKNWNHFNYVNDFKDLKHSAQKAYFRYLNVTGPLFLENRFDPSKRSEVLMATIYACGLTFIEKNELNTLFKNYCYEIILNHLRNLDFHPTLEEMQIIVLIHQGLKQVRMLSRWIESRFESLGHLIHQLGLPFTPKKISCENTILERKLCFCAFIHISVVRMISYNSPSPFPSYLYDDTVDLVTLALKLSNNGRDIGSMLMGESNYHASLIYINFYECKKSYEGSYEESESFVKANIIKLRTRLELIYKKYTNLRKMGILNNDNDKLIIDNVRSGYFTYTLLLSRYLLLRAQTSHSALSLPNRIELCQKNVETRACELLKHVINVPPSERMYIHFGMVYFALSFIYLHLDKVSPQNQIFVDKGIEILQAPEKSPLSSESAPHLRDVVYLFKGLKGFE